VPLSSLRHHVSKITFQRSNFGDDFTTVNRDEQLGLALDLEGWNTVY
jgi:hypothetical protein